MNQFLNLLAATDSQSLNLILWIIAVVVGVYGIVIAFRGEVLIGALLIVAALLIGPGGVSLFG